LIKLKASIPLQRVGAAEGLVIKVSLRMLQADSSEGYCLMGPLHNWVPSSFKSCF